MEEFTSTEFALARNFGFDITMPDSSMGLAGALHQAYIDRCQILYREFISNMTNYIKAEKGIKKVLGDIHTEKINNMRYSLYCSENNDLDPFTQRQKILSHSPLRAESRGNTPWGLDVIPDVDEENASVRPKTAPIRETKPTFTCEAIRPKTAVATGPEVDNETETEVETVDEPTVIGLVDLDTERSTTRRITVEPQCFDKLGRTTVNAKLKNKHGRYLMRPLKVQYDPENSETSMTAAYDPSKKKITYDPVNEKVALVRKLTKFSTPTISSDLKINNRVPIQKNLKGLNAKRITVSEIFQNARDRKTRHFRIIKFSNQTDQPKLSVDRNPRSRLSDKRDNDTKDHPYLRSPSVNATRFDTASPILFGQNTTDEHDLCSSYGSLRQHPKSILHCNNTDMEAGRGRNCVSRPDVNLDSSFRRSGSRVAFARSDSQLSHSASHLHISRETPDLSASLNSIHAYGKKSSFTGNHDSPERAQTESKYGNITPSGAKHVRKASNIERSESALSFTLPANLESRTATDYIVRKQREIDEQLNAQMTVWRRRMNAKPSTSKSANRTKPGKGPKLRLI